MRHSISLVLATLLLAGCGVPDKPQGLGTAMPETAILSAPAATAEELAQAIRSGQLTAEAGVQAYLARIQALDRSGPRLQSIIAINPQALAEARALDAEAAQGRFKGPLHGVPVLIKDNVETRELATTAGSLALIDNHTGRDAPIIARLREQGAIILGKTNLSEWANFRAQRSISGWSGVGGQTRNPHSLDRTPCGSSAGSGSAIAAQLAPLAIGTETNGSITCPASMNGVVGFKPTVGLLSRTHIVPISSTQDSAGPMTRSVRDAALMLNAMAGSDEQDPATALADDKRENYVHALSRGVEGMRIGVFRWAVGKHPAVTAAFNQAMAVLEAQGAVLVDIDGFQPAQVLWESGETLLRNEFKHTLNLYLANAAEGVTVRSLSALIAFNDEHADRELALFDQSLLIASETSPAVTDPAHLEMVAAISKGAREDGIDALLDQHKVEVVVMPTGRPPSPLDVAFTSRGGGPPIGAGWLAAMAGYPILSVPMGSYRGLPLGLSIMGTAWSDGTVLAVGHAYETAAGVELVPTFASGPFEHVETADAMKPYRPSGASGQ